MHHKIKVLNNEVQLVEAYRSLNCVVLSISC